MNDELQGKLSAEEREIVRRLADGEDPWTIDPVCGCTNPLTGYFPSAEVAAERARRDGAGPGGGTGTG